MQFNCIQFFSGASGKSQGKCIEGAFREGTWRGLEGAERDVSEKGVYCLTRSIGLNCLTHPKISNN